MEGKEIWNDVDDDKAAKGFGYIGKEWFDLPARKAMNQVWEIKTHGTRPGGPTLGDIAKKQLLGYRKNNYDFMQNVTFNAARNSHSLTSAMSAYSRAQRNLLDKDEIEKAYQEFNTRRMTIAGNTIQNVKDMRAVGKSDTEIMKALKSASLPSLMIKGALDGLPPEQIVAVMGSPDKKLTAADKLEEIMAEAKEHPEGGDVIKRLAELGKTDYPMYKRVWAQYKGQQKENALGYEGTDSMIHSMSESDGTRARYLGTRYQNLVSTSGREQAVQYLKGLEKKGLIGPATRQALIQAGVSSR